MTAVMSTSLNVVSIAAVRCASTSRLAIVWRRLVMRTRVSVRSPLARGGAGRASRDGAPCRWLVRRPRRGRCRRVAGRCRGAAERGLDVLLHDAAAGAGALHGAEIDVVGFGHAAGGRRRARARRPPAQAAVRPPPPERWSQAEPLPAGFGAAVRRGALVEHGQQLADLHVLAFLPLDAGDDAAAVGVDLEVDLLGLELDDRLAELDAVAFLLQPARDARLDDGLTKFRDNDVRHMRLTFAAGQTPDRLWTGPSNLPRRDSRDRTPARRAPSD